MATLYLTVVNDVVLDSIHSTYKFTGLVRQRHRYAKGDVTILTAKIRPQD